MKTYADVAAYLARKKGKYEKMQESPLSSHKNTAQLMLMRLKEKEDQLFNDQEMSKPIEPQQQELPKYLNGGYQPWNNFASTNPQYYPDVEPIFDNTNWGEILESQAADKRPITMQPIKPSNISIPLNTKSQQVVASPEIPVTKVQPYQNWWDKNKNSLGQFADTLGSSLVGYFGQQQAINRMKSPTAPIYTPGVTLNKNMETGSMYSDVNRAERTAQLNAQRFAPNAQSAMAGINRASGMAMGQRGKIADASTNYRNQMANRETELNWRNNMQNTMLANDYMNTVNAFDNNKVMAQANNFQQLMGNTQRGIGENKQRKLDLAKFQMLLNTVDPKVKENLMTILNSYWQG